MAINYDEYLYNTKTHYISNCGSDENGAYSGGKAGDQTGNEWVLKAWYNRPWDCVLRYPDQNVALLFAELAIEAALNDNIGYDQNQRDTFWDELQKADYRPSKITTPCEADCSSGVIAIIKAVGYILGIKELQNITATYTGNMKSALSAAGFEVLTAAKYTGGSQYLLPGDVNLNESHHTAFTVTVGSKASFNPTSDTTTDTGNSGTTSDSKTVEELADEVIAGKWGNDPDRTEKLTAAGYDAAAVQALVNEKMGVSSSTSSSTTVNEILPSYSVGTNYTVQVNGLYIRKGAGTNYAKKMYSDLTTNAKANGHKDSEGYGYFNKGVAVTCQATKVVGTEVWMQIPSGWVAAYYNKKKYIA